MRSHTYVHILTYSSGAKEIGKALIDFLLQLGISSVIDHGCIAYRSIDTVR